MSLEIITLVLCHTATTWVKDFPQKQREVIANSVKIDLIYFRKKSGTIVCAYPCSLSYERTTGV